MIYDLFIYFFYLKKKKKKKIGKQGAIPLNFMHNGHIRFRLQDKVIIISYIYKYIKIYRFIYIYKYIKIYIFIYIYIYISSRRKKEK